MTVVVDGCGVSRPPNLVRLAIGAGLSRLSRGSRSHRAAMDVTEEEILNSARRALGVEEERRGEGGWGLLRENGREGKARRVFLGMASLYGADPVRSRVVLARLGCDLETISFWTGLTSSRCGKGDWILGYLAIYTVSSSDGCYRRSRQRAGVTFTKLQVRSSVACCLTPDECLISTVAAAEARWRLIA